MEQEEVKVSVSTDKMEAILYLPSNTRLSQEEIDALLEENGVSSGINEEVSFPLSDEHMETDVEIRVAQGIEAEDGKDGQVVFEKPLTMEVDPEEKTSFRDILTIPTVTKGERMARCLPHTNGEPGINIFGETIRAKPGKPSSVKAGKNTFYQPSDESFYSEIDGQLSYDGRTIQVHPLYEVQGDLDLHTGNLDFVGSILIRGNVPTGFTVKAEGDITVYGMVEAAEIIAGGSVHISEGIAGLGKAFVKAEQDVRVGYINQAVVEAGKDLFVENSALHSQCVARRSVYSQKGNIIGGTISAGNRVEAQDIGNRMYTPTGVYIGVNKKVEENKGKINRGLKEKITQKEKLVQTGRALEQKRRKYDGLSAKERITSLRQRNALEALETDIHELAEQLQSMTSTMGDLEGSYIKVDRCIYAFTTIGFGKYIHRVEKDQLNVSVIQEDGEIVIKANEG